LTAAAAAAAIKLFYMGGQGMGGQGQQGTEGWQLLQWQQRPEACWQKFVLYGAAHPLEYAHCLGHKPHHHAWLI
jgi:hypothetical protein